MLERINGIIGLIKLIVVVFVVNWDKKFEWKYFFNFYVFLRLKWILGDENSICYLNYFH